MALDLYTDQKIKKNVMAPQKQLELLKSKFFR